MRQWRGHEGRLNCEEGIRVSGAFLGNGAFGRMPDDGVSG
jgi:hypothetical protein